MNFRDASPASRLNNQLPDNSVPRPLLHLPPEVPGLQVRAVLSGYRRVRLP